MLLLNLIFPSVSGITSNFVYLLVVSFWFSVIVSGLRYIVQNGAEFVQWPKLVPVVYKRTEVQEFATQKQPVEEIPLKNMS
jgi:hypothetical protein